MVEESTLPVIPGHRVEGIIGAGGFATVYEAVDLQLDRRVAVKVFGTHLSVDRMREQFEREARAASALGDHPNIVTIYQSGFTDEERPYLTMALMKSSLGEVTSLPTEQAVSIGVKTAAALGSAHDAGIVHGDVKPDNILLNRFGEPALADFGIATIDGAEKSKGPQSFSAMYAAPEVLDDEPATPLSDIYSLGSTLYGLMAGRPPFSRDEGMSMAAFLSARSETPHPRLDLGGDSSVLSDLIGEMTALEPSSRPQSASEVRDRLGSFEESMGWTVTRSVVGPGPFATTDPGPDPTPGRRKPLVFTAVIGALLVAAVGAFLILSDRGDDEDAAPPDTSDTRADTNSETNDESDTAAPSTPPSDSATTVPAVAGRPGEPPTDREVTQFQQSASILFGQPLDTEMVECIVDRSLPNMSDLGRSDFVRVANPFLFSEPDMRIALGAIDDCVDVETAAVLSLPLWFKKSPGWQVDAGLTDECLVEGPVTSFASAGETIAHATFDTRQFADMAARTIQECDARAGDPNGPARRDVVDLWLSSTNADIGTSQCMRENLAVDPEQALLDVFHSQELLYHVQLKSFPVLSDIYKINFYTERAETPLLTAVSDKCGFGPYSG